MTLYNSKELRKMKPEELDSIQMEKNPIYFVLDEVLDTYNIGSLFRLADAIGVTKMFLCGNMEYPPSSRIHKSAVGTETWVPWEKRDTGIEVVRELKKRGVFTIAAEQDSRSIDIRNMNDNNLRFPVAIVVGHESFGVKTEILDEVDLIIELPMYGINKSFNVWGTAAVLSYKILEFLK